MKTKMKLNGQWKLGSMKKDSRTPNDVEKWINAVVPGDVNDELSKKGIIHKNLFYKKNLMDTKWVDKQYWWYRKTFSFKGPKKDNMQLVFDGLDTFTRVYLNGKLLGETNNMHLQYRFDVNDKIKIGKNEIMVQILPTRKIVAKLFKKYPDYLVIFYNGRNLIRKAQCQFSWDWAPDALSIGIWRDVYIENFDDSTIEDVYVETSLDGQLCFRVLISGNLTPAADEREREGGGAGKALAKNLYNIKVSVTDGKKTYSASISVSGRNNVINLKIPDPKLWWPNGYGEPFLYQYNVDLTYKLSKKHSYKGTFGIRKVEIRENMVDEQTNAFTFYVNDVPVYCKGANFIPSDCFPGRVRDNLYENLVSRAAEANYNMLRLWGGGIYEKDGFYDLCDRKGIMIWQDFMNACAEIPDDQMWFLENMIKEATYQVTRLRNHPCIVTWCGGNESSSYNMFQPDRPGFKMVNYYLRGVVASLHKEAAYIPNSPHSKGDYGQYKLSGDTHSSTWPRTPNEQYGNFRDRVRDVLSVFNSEACLMSPSPMESILKFADYEDIFPPNDVMDYHLMYHPYSLGTHPRFVISQLKMAEQIIGECSNAEQFIDNAMMAQVEMMTEELGYYRSQKYKNSGTLLWMYNECWPCCNWAVVDYYGYLKPSFYTSRRMFAPLAVCVKIIDGIYQTFLMNDTLKDAEGSLKLSYRNIHGEIHWSKTYSGLCPANKSVAKAGISPAKLNETDSFIHAVWKVGKTLLKSNYFPKHWKEISFEKADYKHVVKSAREKDQFVYVIDLNSKNYSRCICIETPGHGPRGLSLSDNYFDMIPNEKKTVKLRCKEQVKKIVVRSLLDSSF